jgi:hypothetical protein
MRNVLIAAAALVAFTVPGHAETRLPECDAHGMAPGLLSRPGVSKVCRTRLPDGKTLLCGEPYPAGGGGVCIIETSGKEP